MQSVVPLISAIIGLIFFLCVLDHFFARRKSYQFLWSIGLLIFVVAAFSEFWAESQGNSPAIYKLFYLTGVMAVSAYLGMGTLYLVIRGKVKHIIMAILGILTLFALVRIIGASLDIAPGQSLLGTTGIMPHDIRILGGIVFPTFGVIAFVGGAIYSAWQFWRRRVMAHRIASSLLIAVGGILLALSGSSSYMGSLPSGYFYQLLGIVVIFLGYLRSQEPFGLYRVPLVHGFARVASK
jgi:hypothetical protein